MPPWLATITAVLPGSAAILLTGPPAVEVTHGSTLPLAASTAARVGAAPPPTLTKYPPTYSVFPASARQLTTLLAPGSHVATAPLATSSLARYGCVRPCTSVK